MFSILWGKAELRGEVGKQRTRGEAQYGEPPAEENPQRPEKKSLC